jgi:5-oxoprolinase (ATP-hydrolysing)
LVPIKIIIPSGSLLDPDDEAAIVGGNVLTSQRVTDVILKAFKACAASQGCMNNVTFGNNVFSYYETIAGGGGAGPGFNGQHGVHSHMTNTRITDPEILEIRYPVILRKFNLRDDESGGKGKFQGGEGVVREFEFLEPVQFSVLSERRVFRPYGMNGGQDGKTGMNLVFQHKKKKWKNLGGKNSLDLVKYDRILIFTPGGGGFGKLGEKENEHIKESNEWDNMGNKQMLDHGSLQYYQKIQEGV